MRKFLKRLIWFIPIVQGVLIGAMLWLAQGMQLSVVLPQWIGIVVILALYGFVLTRLTSIRQNSADEKTADQPSQLSHPQPSSLRTIVQTNYLRALQTRSQRREA